MRSVSAVVRFGAAVLPVLVLGGMGAKAFIASPSPKLDLAISSRTNGTAVQQAVAVSSNIETATRVETSQTVSMALAGGSGSVQTSTSLSVSALPVILPVRTPVRP